MKQIRSYSVKTKMTVPAKRAHPLHIRKNHQQRILVNNGI